MTAILLDPAAAETLVEAACRGAGATAASARSLTDATLSAARFGPETLGFPHLLDYLDSYRDGRINPDPAPRVEQPLPAFLIGNADRGIAQLGFDRAFDALVAAVRTCGIAIFTQGNSYTTGELGYYARRLAGAGIASLAATNANAMVAPRAGGAKVYSTNPLAFGFPLGDGRPPVLIDQSSSATAFVNLKAAAAAGQTIPHGIAVDEEGHDTDDPLRAMAGALLPFGGRKGANLALMVEMLAAGLSGANWSVDAPDFQTGDRSPAVSLTVIAFLPEAGGGEPDDRIARHLARIEALGVHVPGVTGRERQPQGRDRLPVPAAVHARLQAYAGRAYSAARSIERANDAVTH